jgi:transcription elongation factor SPT6
MNLFCSVSNLSNYFDLFSCQCCCSMTFFSSNRNVLQKDFSLLISASVVTLTGIVKRAVALGRYLQNPLAMIATLCGPGREILSWKLCPLEQFLTPDEKFEMVEQIMVDATNQIGIDVNLASSHEWLFAPLQFVAGLGPRKAAGLQKAFVRAGSVVSRKEISGFLRKKVFYNCIGFLRVCRTGAAGSALAVDVLDDTRIHPESYELAGDMAKDVYADDLSQDANEMDEDEAMLAIEHVKTKKPHMLEALNIDEYMKSLPDGKRKRETLYDIKMELLHGFQDWRAPFREPTSEEEFLMLSGETEESIAEGTIVQVTVRSVQESRYVCALDSGLRAFITFDDFEGYDPDSEQVREGDIITAKIKSVNKARCLVYLTTKESDMRRRHYVKHDQYYHENDVSSRTERDKAQKKKELVKKHFKPRMIVHPRFQNLTADEATEVLYYLIWNYICFTGLPKLLSVIDGANKVALIIILLI